MKRDRTDYPVWFAKFASGLVAQNAPVLVPAESTQVDYEAELGVVIATAAKHVTEARALDHVEGYICLNDVSARDLQFGDGQWTRGKSPDTFCPVGPKLVPREEIDDPQALAIRCVLNGRTMQDSSTSQMIFSVAEIIAYVSRTVTLPVLGAMTAAEAVFAPVTAGGFAVGWVTTQAYEATV